MLGRWVFDKLTINEASNPHPDEQDKLARFDQMFRDNNITFDFGPDKVLNIASKGKTNTGTYGLLKDGTTVQVYVKGNSPDLFEITNITENTFTIYLPHDLPYHVMHYKKVEQ